MGKTNKLFSAIIILFIFFLSNILIAQPYNPSWSNTVEYVYSEIEKRVKDESDLTIDELQLCRSFYSNEILQEEYYIMRVVRNDSVNMLNAESFIDYETNKIVGWYKSFMQMNNNSQPTAHKDILPPNALGVGDTVRPDPGPPQPPCSNLGFEDGTMNSWTACGAQTFSVPSNALYPGSPPNMWGFLAYNLPCCNNRMKADCYGPTGNFTKAANCYNYIPAVPTPPYSDSYQLRVFNAGDNDSLYPVMPAVYPGMSHSVMVGDYCGVGLGAAILQQKFLVTPSNAAFTYNYAVFLQNPSGHGYTQQPTFQVNFLDDDGDTIAGCGSYFVVAGPNLPGWIKISNINYLHSWADSTYVKPWECAFVSLRKYIGQNVTVQFITRDCGQGAHFGYAYVSAQCDSLTIKKTPSGNCQNKSAILTAPTSCGISGYQWSGPCISGPTNGASITVTCDGVYQVILTSAAGGCSDTITDTVHLASIGGIQAGFTSSGICGNITFTDTSNISSATYNWSFPGGSPSSSTSQNPPTVTYPTGTYTVTLIVADSLGCADTVTQVVTVNNPPLISNFSANIVCLGVPTNFNDLSIGSPTSWNWNFGNGNSSSLQNPSTTYSASGTYSVTLVTSNGMCGQDTVIIPVTVNPLPVANFSNTPVCFNNPTVFTDLSAGNNSVSNWNWNFGDGSNSTQQNPSHTYNAAGTYTATLVVTNNFGCVDSLLLVTVVNPLPVANFSSSPVCLGGQTCFSDISSVSTGTVTGWSWNFGEPSSSNNTSSLQNPCHIFSSAGVFTVILTATTNNNCQSTVSQTITVNPAPTAAFSSTFPCLGTSVILTDGSIAAQGDPITSWSWSIPGGTPSSSANHNTSTIYSAGGTHNVTLIVTSQLGCKDTIVQQVLVYRPPVAGLSGAGSGCAPLCVTNYQDLSISPDGNIVGWSWTFPGGTPSNSTQQNPGAVCYNTPGTYPVSLIVITNYGCSDTVTNPGQVSAYAGAHADFCVVPDQAPATDPVFNFCPLWTPNPGVTNWVWNFGDGVIDSINTSPSHSYLSSALANDYYTFTVTLYVQNQYGCWDTISKTVELLPEFEFYIPNSFSPNGDFINEFFFGKGRGIKEYDIYLFDRWGNRIWDCHYEGDNTDWDISGKDGMSSACKWDGKIEPGGLDMSGRSGQLAQEDVYVWKVDLIDVFGKPHHYVGHVSIVK